MGATEQVVATPVEPGKESQESQAYQEVPGGNFAAGNPGKPKGARSKHSVHMESVREEIVGSWHQLGESKDGKTGMERLVELADTNFEAYLHAIAKFMPKGAQVQVTIPAFIQPNPQIYAPGTINLIEELEAKAGDGEITKSMFLESLRVHARAGPATNGTAKRNGKSNGHAK